MIEKFPTFSKIDISSQKDIEQITSVFAPYSDFNFTSLFCWNIDGSSEVSILNGNLVIKMPDYVTGESMFSILGNNLIDKSLGQLFSLTSSLKLVPQTVIDHLEHKNAYKIAEDRDNFDYIVSGEALAKLDENVLPKKHKMVREFHEKYPDAEVKYINLDNPQNREDILGFIEIWRKLKHKSQAEIENEHRAVRRLIEFRNYFPTLTCIGIYNQGELVAFNTFEIANKEFGISSFQKADHNLSHIYAVLTQEMAKDLSERGCGSINFEQDLGIQGLRDSKLSWHPTSFLKKYTVTKAA